MSYHIPVDILFDKCEKPPPGKVVIEPFTSDGQILRWLGDDYIVIPYDSDPVYPKVIKNDVFESKIHYAGCYVVTRVPQLKKSESLNKDVFIRYGTDNLYKCFINFLIADQPQGGIITVPLSFLNGTRESEIKRRLNFFIIFKVIRFNVFDINTIVIQFIKRTYYDSSYKDIWPFNFYEENALTKQITYNISNFTLPGANHFEFSLQEQPTKRVHVRYDDPVSLQTNETATLLVFDLGHMRLSFTKQNFTKQSIANLNIQTMVVIVKGHASNSLQERIMNDYNAWIANYQLNVHTLFRSPITQKIGLEAIRRIVHSYWKTV